MAKSSNKTRSVVIALGFVLVAGGSYYAGNLSANPEAIESVAPAFTEDLTDDGDTPADDSARTVLANRLLEVSGMLTSEALVSPTLASATAGSIQGLLTSSGDEYAQYYTPDSYASYQRVMSGEYAGIGVVVSQLGGSIQVVKVYENSPAQAAGMMVGDKIVSVNGESRDWTAEEFACEVAGDPGTEVTVTWIAENSDTEVKATMAVAKVESQNVTYKNEDGYGVIDIVQFDENTFEAMNGALVDLESQNVSGYVIDLRQNPGGQLDQAIKVASLFIKQGTIVEVTTAEGDTQRRNVETDDYESDAPLVLLVNSNTASAAEAFAGAIQDHKRGVLVGTKTFGKGSIQTIREVSFGGAIKYTIAEFTTPDGNVVNHVGILPDLILDMDSTLVGIEDKDIQMDAAKDAVKAIAAAGSVEIDGLSNSAGPNPELLVDQPKEIPTPTETVEGEESESVVETLNNESNKPGDLPNGETTS